MPPHLWLRFRFLFLLSAFFAAVALGSLATFAYDGHSSIAAKTINPAAVRFSQA